MLSFRFSIRLKLIFSFFILVLVIITVFTIFSYFRTLDAMQNEIQKRGIDVTKTFTQMAATYIFEMDYITILDNANELVESSDIQSITVMDTSGKVWISTNNSQKNSVSFDSFYEDIINNKELTYRKNWKDDQWVLEFVSPIIALGKVAYLLNVEISMKNLENQLAESTREIFILSFVVITLAVLLGIALSKLLTAPIKQLVKGTNEISHGNLDYRIKVPSQDEIGELAQSFNLMTDNLQKELSERKHAEDRLRKHRDHLEELVENRTAEIKKAFSNLQVEISERKLAEETLREGERRLRRQNETLMVLARHKALYDGDLNAALREFTEASARTLEVERTSVWLYNEDRSKIHCVELYEMSAERHSEGIKLAKLDYPSYFNALETERTISASDAHTDPRTKEFSESYLSPFGITSMLDAPIWVSGKMVGVACHEHVGAMRQWKMDEQNFAGSIADFISLSLEISEHKLAEKTKEQLEARLQRAQKMEAIGTLAGGVAHDLNNILSGIVSYPDLLLMQLPENSPLRKPIATIQGSGIKAAAIVQDLLTLARRGVAITEVVNLNDIIDEYQISPESGKLKSYHPFVEIETSLEPDLLNILGSPVHLSKTVMNLVSNAAEAMPDGGKIFISTANRYIDQPIRGYDDVQEGDYVVLTVSDNGIGISSDDINRIFEPFYTKKTMGRSGTGLGMAVVWGTVKDHKGYIEAQGNQGQGTTFTLYFPVTRKELAKDKISLSIDEFKGNGQSVLVVDDVKEQREIASSILSELGYSVTTVSSGEAAVDYMKENTADLVVLDMIMEPGIDGFETYKKITALRPEQKTIIASGFSETDRVRKAQKLGAGKYVKKPYTVEKIGLAVKKELKK